MRDDRPAGDQTPRAVWFAYSPDRKGEPPQAHLSKFTGTLRADVYAGFGQIYPALFGVAPNTISGPWGKPHILEETTLTVLCGCFQFLIGIRIPTRHERRNTMSVRLACPSLVKYMNTLR